MFITYYFVLRFFLSIAYYMLFMVAVAATITNLNIIVFAIFNVAIVIVILVVVAIITVPACYYYSCRCFGGATLPRKFQKGTLSGPPKYTFLEIQIFWEYIEL